MNAFVELDFRSSGQLEVSLLWNQLDGTLFVQIIDWETDEAFTVQTPPDRALDTFRHPFAYAPAYVGIVEPD